MALRVMGDLFDFGLGFRVRGGGGVFSSQWNLEGESQKSWDFTKKTFRLYRLFSGCTLNKDI